jgi:hypothetical protein
MLLVAASPAGGLAQTTSPAAASRKPLLRRHTEAPKPAVTTRMQVDDWASLSQGINPLGAPLARVDLRAHDEANDDIVVYDKKFVRPTQELSIEQIGAEPTQTDAAQPLVPFLGSGCDKGSACIDPAQQGLLSTLPALFGSH